MQAKKTLIERTRAIQLVVFIAIALGAGFVMGSQYSTITAQNGVSLSQEAEVAFEPLFEAFNLVQDNYLDDPEIAALVDGAITGMIDVLDVHSGYVTPEFAPFVDSRLAGEIEGIGATIIEVEETGEIEVLNVLPDTPAERSGILAGDRFQTVNGEDVIGLSTLEVASRVRGPVGTTVDITMRRGDDLVDFTIERARIELNAVNSEMLEDNIGYISLTSFSANARSQIDAALAELDVENLNGLIFDLRNNGGGFLDTGLEITSLFIEEGDLLREEFGTGEERIFRVEDGVVYQVFEGGSERVYTNDASFANIAVPIVLLVNENSASASELVAGAWQETGVATLIGTQTFGKGTVQQVIELSNDGTLRLTIARWLTPSGASIHGEGITPDIVIELPELGEGEEPVEGFDLQLDEAIRYLQGVSVSTME